MDSNTNTNQADSQAPIGVFDSGVGGLTVLRVLAERFPSENFIYLGDTARLPYGSKSPLTIRKYSEQALLFLREQKVKALVVACNSASSTMPEDEFAKLPLITVIRPGAEMAVQNSISAGQRIGILGTQATVASGAYPNEIRKICEQLSSTVANSLHIETFSQAAPLFVPLAEEGWIDDPVTNLIAYRYLSPLLKNNIDTLILGCTHYPILRDAIQRVCGRNVTLIDSGAAVARRLQGLIQSGRVPSNTVATAQSRRIELLCTDNSTQFEYLAKELLRPHAVEKLQVVTL